MKNILITGASSGIGKSIAKALENKGFRLIRTGRRELDLKDYYSCNLDDLENVRILYNKVFEEFCGVDILINNAGEYLYSPVENVDKKRIISLFNTNFLSHYYLTSLVVSGMKKKNWGRIINISSISGVVGEANASLYAASKSAFYGFSKSLALELAQFNITVNSISPGWVETPLVEHALDENEISETLDIIPQRRFVEPCEIANLVKYLISENAKGITGQNINVCAGLTCGC